MFDESVMEEGLGQAAVALDREAGRRPAPPMGASPDGLGAYAEALDDPMSRMTQQSAPRAMHPQQMQYPPHSQMQGEIDFLEPEDTSSGAATKSGGLTFLLVALSTGIGYALRGGLGSASGLLLSAGLANGYRAQKWWGSPDPSEKHEAIVSGVFAFSELAGGLYVGYKAFQDPKSKKN